MKQIKKQPRQTVQAVKKKMNQTELQNIAEQQLKKVLKELKIYSVGIQVVSKKKMIQLNAEYRKKPVDTDILSFPVLEIFKNPRMSLEATPQQYLGDLVLSYSQVLKQAREFGHSPMREVLILVVHGVLHLKGYDHEVNAKSFEKMLRAEQQLLLRCGLKKQDAGLISRAQLIKNVYK
jgi:rRNA maturation RNase YbeY